MNDIGHWKCPLCGFRDSAEQVVDPDFPGRIEAHKREHLDRYGGNENVLSDWRRQLAQGGPR